MASIKAIQLAYFLIITGLFIGLVVYSNSEGRTHVEEAVGKSSILLAQDTAKLIEDSILIKFVELSDFTNQNEVQNELMKSNSEFLNTDLSKIDIEQQWTTEFSNEITSNNISQELKQRFVDKINKRTGTSPYGEVFITNAQGLIIAQSGTATDYYQGDETWWQKAVEYGYHVAATEFDESANTYVIPVSLKITDEQGEFLGVIKAGISSGGIIMEAAFATRYDDSTEVNIISSDGKLVYSSKAFVFNQDMTSSPIFDNLQGENGIFTERIVEHDELIAYAKPAKEGVLSEQNWYILLRHEMGSSGIMEGRDDLMKSTITASIIIVGIVAIIGFLFSSYVERAISKLIHMTHQIANKNFDTKSDVKTISEFSHLADSLYDMGQDIKTANRKKDEFSGMISHELKTPLVPVRGYAEMLRNPKFGDLNPDQKEAVEEIYQNTMKLDRLLSNIITAQSLEFNDVIYKNENNSVDDIFEELQKQFSESYQQKNVVLNVAGEKNLQVYGDKTKIKEVLANMIENSLSFVAEETGVVEMSATVKNNEIEFYVKDNGKGIPDNEKEDLFKQFSQLDSSHTRKHGGTGLGLSICKGYVEGMGGKIWVKSQEGEGTTFYFVLPTGESA